MAAAPLMPREPPATSTVPTERLWSASVLGRTTQADRVAREREDVGLLVAGRRDADGHDHDVAGAAVAGAHEVARPSGRAA